MQLIDRNGVTFRMSLRQIVEGLKAMGVPPGRYTFLPPTPHNESMGGYTFVRFKPRYSPYWFYQRWYKRLIHVFSEYKRIRALKREAPEGFIIKPNKFILEKPWLQLKYSERYEVEV